MQKIETKLQVQRYLSMGSLGEARKAAVLGLTTTMILVLCVGWLGLVSANVKIIALDKNPNAIVTLRNMIIQENLQDRVRLISGDMRHLQVEDMQGDILMSELLGSFGDNELSPECLIPTEKFLKPQGIYIPWAYTNHLVPISS